MLSTPRENGSISVGRSSVWETTRIRSYVEFRVPEDWQPTVLAPRGVTGQFKSLTLYPLQGKPMLCSLRF